MSTKQKFKKYLTKIEYPKKFEGWHIKGMLKKHSNKSYKFDITDIIKRSGNYYEKIGSFKNKAEKKYYKNNKEKKLDIEELHTYIKENKLKDVNLHELINSLEWNIIVKK